MKLLYYSPSYIEIRVFGKKGEYRFIIWDGGADARRLKKLWILRQ